MDPRGQIDDHAWFAVKAFSFLFFLELERETKISTATSTSLHPPAAGRRARPTARQPTAPVVSPSGVNKRLFKYFD